MTGRTFTGFIAVFSTTLLLILNLMVTVGGVASLVIEFLLEHRPSQTGWLLVIVSAFTVASGLIGLCSSTRRGCFTLQLVLLAFSLVGLIAAALSIFFKAQQVLNDMSPKIARNTAIKVLRLDAAVLFITFCVQVAVLVLGVCVNCCDLNDHYEEIEMNRGMARTQGAADNRAAMKGESKAAQLAERMKKKYGSGLRMDLIPRIPSSKHIRSKGQRETSISMVSKLLKLPRAGCLVCLIQEIHYYSSKMLVRFW